MISDERDLVGYGNQRPVVAWPGGARLALSFVINYEAGAEQSLADGDGADESQGEWGNFDLGPGVRNYTLESFSEYGSRAGVWRLLDVLDRHEVSGTIFACAQALERNPPLAEVLAGGRHEIASHGFRWEDHLGLSPEEDLRRIRQAVASFERTVGVRPIGWHSRNGLKMQTRELLVREGFLYDSNVYNDDQPYYLSVADKPHLVLPYSADTNDTKYWRSPGFVTPGMYLDYLRDTFDVLMAESQAVPKMMTVGLHDRISGRPARSLAVSRFLEYALSRGDVWIARRDEIARFWLANVPV